LRLIALVIIGGQCVCVSASEPAEEFLNQVRRARYFDIAIAYLDRSDKMAGLSPEFKAAVNLEKALTYIDAAVASKKTTERDEFFVSAQESLKSFLGVKDHPRASEAKLLLGKLQMVRGAQMMAKPDPADADRAAARQSYGEATKTFDGIVTDLRTILEGLKGQRIDAAKEPAKAAQRDQYRGEFLIAQLRGAEARLAAANTFADPVKEGKPLLEDSLKTFRDLSEKYDDYLQGALAMVSRGQIQAKLGMNADAIDSFQRVLERAEVEALRPSRMQAIAGFVELWSAASPPKFGDAIQLGQGFVDTARGDEKRSQEFQDLQLALAQAYLANAADLKASGKKAAEEKRSTSNARTLLIAATKVTGTHESKAKKMLAALGIEQTEDASPVEIKDVKSLEEALTVARDNLSSSGELASAAKMLQDQKNKGSLPDGGEAQLAELQAQIAKHSEATVEVIRRGLAIGSGDSSLLNQARQYLASALYQSDRFLEAAVVGQFLAKAAPNDSMGLYGGRLAMSSYQQMMSDADAEQSAAIVERIEALGEMLIRQWPDDPGAAAAKGVMIQLALERDNWSEARRLLDEMAGGDDKAKFQRLMGQLMWNQWMVLHQEKKDAEAAELLPEAATQLRAGLEGIPGELAGPEAMQAAVVLAKVELRRGDPASAISVLDNEKYGPIKLVGSLAESGEDLKSELYRVELQSVVGVMTGDTTDKQALLLLKRATTAMDNLQSSVADKPDASDRLVRIYLGLANDIREQLDTATPDRKAKLIGAFRVFLDSIAKSSEDPATLQWAGRTLMQMGESSMEPGQRVAQGQAKELLTSAVTTLGDLVTKQGDAASPALVYQLAMAHRLNGEFPKAIDLLESVLVKNNAMLDAQIEAATAYELWAGTVAPQFSGRAYDAALRGARPDAKNKNTIWGWGRISKMVSGKEPFRDTFFESRYHVALCRYLMGKAEKNNSIIEQSEKDITQVSALYPQLGGPGKRAQFDLLMKEIQKSLGKKPDGLPPL